MSEYSEIKNIRDRFGKLSTTAKSLTLEILEADVMSARTAKARAAIGKSGKRRGRKPKQPQNDEQPTAKVAKTVVEKVAVPA